MAQGQSGDDSVYDFLYVDARRIGLLLSQFGQEGLLTELIKETQTESDSSSGFDLKVMKVDSTEGETQALTKHFDPQWLLPLRFLDLAQTMLVKDVSKAGIGQLVLASGSLGIMDLKMLQQAWNIKEVQAKVLEGATQNVPKAMANTQAAKQAKKEHEQLSQMMLGFLKIFPHTVQAALKTAEDATIWAILDEPNLITPAGYLSLKHGLMVQGQWNIVGILDALPSPDATPQATTAESLAALTLFGSPIAMVMVHIGPAAKMLLGRPNSSYGVTPLLVFRKIEH